MSAVGGSQPGDDGRAQEHRLVAERRARLGQWRKQSPAWPNRVQREHFAGDLQARHREHDREHLEELRARVSVAGRVIRERGPFRVLLDMTGVIQLYVDRKALAGEALRAIEAWKCGDIVEAQGELRRSRKGDLYVHVESARLLAPALRPLPDKFHGLSDREARYRQRYLDLLANPGSVEVFRARARLVEGLRRFFLARRFEEVETPMLHAIPGGAAARPFVTRHNSLQADMYLRVAPELFLKRLVIGGMERVFEINRCFRNEGLSTRHNPEFTTVEFYQAYATYEDLMRLCEELLRELAQRVAGGESPPPQLEGEEREDGEGVELCDWSAPFARMTMREALLAHNPGLAPAHFDDLDALRERARAAGLDPQEDWGAGKIETELFEKTVESRLLRPTFVTEYPVETSPLARRVDGRPDRVERFELFAGGREIANGFSELNDPEDQAARFREQARRHGAGDKEAMRYDGDYVVAMEYGMPPVAGCGIGVDRLTMLLTGAASIRDVILFPQLRAPAAGPS